MQQKDMKIRKDIYSLAFVAIIHPMECEQIANSKVKYMPRIHL